MMASNQWRRKLQILLPGVTSPKQGLGLCSSGFNVSISILVSSETHHPLIHIESALLCSVGQPGSMLAGFPLVAPKQIITFQPAISSQDQTAGNQKSLNVQQGGYFIFTTSCFSLWMYFYHAAPLANVCLVYILIPTSSYLMKTFQCCFEHWRKLGEKYLNLILVIWLK